MTINEIRSKYIAFMEARGHAHIPSASIVPQNDPTTLFTGSGMQPMLPYLLGEVHPKGTRIVDSQKSFRAGDIEEVGDNRHTTFFEMLGNWSLGDYFQEEQLSWMFEFLVDEVGINPENLYVTTFIGDEAADLPRDTVATDIWKRLFATKGIEAKDVVIGSEADGYTKGMQGGRIFYYDVSKNWWSRAGVPSKMPVGEPGGPDSEMFYDFGSEHDTKYGLNCHPNCDCGRFIEIGNNVFMQYIKKSDGSFETLPKKNIDFGGGIERIAAAANNDADVFNTDVFSSIIDLLSKFSGKSYDDTKWTRSFRIIADHMRASVFLIAAGVRPANSDRGYILRRLLRRAALQAQNLGVEIDQREESILNRCAVIILEKYKLAYPELATDEMYKEITSEIWKEEKQFGHTLESGMRELEKMTKEGLITGEQVFTLFTTYGFPYELTEEIARERGIVLDKSTFEILMESHRALSREGGEQKFKGGLADSSEKTTQLHTAHHLLLRALQIVLGDSVKQRGSNITSERLRIDFSYGAKMTPEQIAQVTHIVNEQIKAHLPIVRSTLPKDDAESIGAEHEFGAKYPDVVSIYSIGPANATIEHPEFALAYSKEFCGGPHVLNTAELENLGSPSTPLGTKFSILKEEAVAAGIRRIKAVLN